MTKRLVQALVYSDVWIGLACGAQIWYSYLLLDLEPDLEMILFGICGTVAVYNWQRLVRISGKVPELHSVRHKWIERNRSSLWTLMLVSLIGAGYCLLSLSITFMLITGMLGLIAFFYTLPWFKGTSRRGLRELPYLKIFLIAICWAAVTAFLPLQEEGAVGWHIALLVAAERFFFILAITIPFDVRDLPFDSPEKRTIPQVFGVKKALGYATDLLLIAFVLVVMILRTYSVHWLAWAALVLGYLVTLLLIRRSDEKAPELHFTGALDGTMILIPALLFLVNYLFA